MIAKGQLSPPSSYNLSRTLNVILEDAEKTGQLILSGKSLKHFPNDETLQYELCDTILLDISNNQLSEIPSLISDFVYLEELLCSNNRIRRIPQSLEQLHYVTILDLSCNQLDLVPECVCNLSSLKILLLPHNRLTSLPNQISNLSTLSMLDISCNEIALLTPQIGLLLALKSLNTSSNSLDDLPEELCQLRLHQLDCSNNRLTKLPVGLREMNGLEKLNIDHNPLVMPPYQVCQKGIWYIMKALHLEALREERQKGTLTDAELRRSFRRSFRHSVSTEYPLLPSEDNRRNTVFSADSGYATISGSGYDVAQQTQAAPISHPERDELLTIPSSVHSGDADTDGGGVTAQKADTSSSYQSLPKPKPGTATTTPPSTSILRRTSYHMAAAARLTPTFDSSSPNLKPPSNRSPAKTMTKSVSDVFSSPVRNLTNGVMTRSVTMTTCGNCSDNSCSQCARIVVSVDDSDVDLRSDEPYPSPPPPCKAVDATDGFENYATLKSKEAMKMSTSSDTLTNYPISTSNRLYQANNNNNNSHHHQEEDEMSSPQAISKAARNFYSSPSKRSENGDIEKQQNVAVYLKEMLEDQLQIRLSSHLRENISDGIVLCHLANHVTPRSIAKIYVPAADEVCLPLSKCRKNVGNFLAACLNAGVPSADLCSAGDVLEGNLENITNAVEKLLNLNQNIPQAIV